MSGLITLDLVVAVLAAAAWLGAGTAAALASDRPDAGRAGTPPAGRGRPGLVIALVGLAILASTGRGATAVLLTRGGWWFGAEKVLIGLPLLFGGAIVALFLAGRQLTTRPPMAGPRGVLALFGAGYAAAAGPVVTLLGGYPVTGSTALITVGLVIGATVATARVLGLSRLRAPAVAAFTAVLIGAALALVAPSTVDSGGGTVAGPGPATVVTELRGADTPAPGGTVRQFTLTARTATVDTPAGRVAAWTFNGQVPGPPITATQGDLIEVTLVNADISAGVTLHWHGYDVAAAEDGAPGLTQDAVPPGQRFVYRFRADQTGTYWYHTHEASDTGVKLGLFGSLVVAPRPATPSRPAELDLVVPIHTLAGKLVIGEHDAPSQRTVAPGTPVRLRLINTDDVPRILELAGTPFRVVAVDGTDLHAPGDLDRTGVRVPAGGRYDLAFTMPAAAVHLGLSTGDGLWFTPAGGSTPAAAPTRGWPLLDLLSYGTPAATAFGAGSRPDRRFTLVLDRGLALTGGRPGYGYTVNGLAYPRVPTEVVRAGELVEFTIVNRSREVHPWHLHGHHVLVLARDGQRPTGSPLWLDTFDVRPGEVWRVVFRADNPGLWMNHCHNLSHAGMAVHLAYQGVVSPFHGGHGG